MNSIDLQFTMLTKLIYFCIFLFLPSIVASNADFGDIYKEAWWDGFYQEGDFWKPWDSSCKSWSNEIQWESWEDYMFLNHTTHLCEHWPQGEYYDLTSDVWRPWNGLWRGQWSYQEIWFEWATDTVLDLQTLEWVGEWNPNTLRVEDSQFNIPSFWRNYEYYIDPFSSESIELGTLSYPYRSMVSANSEILNLHSHSNASITIYIKNTYIKEGELNFYNISSISIKSHPDLSETLKKAVLIPTPIDQPGILK